MTPKEKAIEYHDRTTIEYWLQVKQEIEKL
jgi:hypothetical protein